LDSSETSEENGSELEGMYDVEELSDDDLVNLAYAPVKITGVVHTALSAFQRSADRFPPLNPEQQLALTDVYHYGRFISAEMQSGKIKGRKDLAAAREAIKQSEIAMEHLCASCWRLEWLLVREQAEMRFGRDRAADMLPDLMAEAHTALVDAVRTFDKTRTPQFHTYAARKVRDHLRAVLSREGFMRLAPSWNRVKRMAVILVPELTGQLGRNPSTEEVQDALLARCLAWADDHLTPDQQKLPESQKQILRMAKLRKQGMLGAVRRIDEVIAASQSVASLDAPVGDAEGTSTLKDLITDVNIDDNLFDAVEMGELQRALSRAMSSLSEREQDIVKLRYGFGVDEPWTYSKIADRHNVTAERVRQIEKAALSKLASPHGQFTALSSFLPSQITD
jgi:RNA polymerase sigma factor (sigma-70 family)